VEPDVTEAPLSEQLRVTRSELMSAEIEDVALALFEERGFGEVTVEDIATAARVSARTFYRYFPAKEDVFQLQIERRTQALRAALATRPPDESPLQSLRLALFSVVSAEDEQYLRRWTSIVAITPSVLPGVLGGIQLKSHRAIADFFADRLGLDPDSTVAITLAAAAGGVIQAAHTQWFVYGDNLADRIAEGLDILEGTLKPIPPEPKPKRRRPRSG
jgi:TetR/AcrR family transcriptional regulator, regulator of mycofactocin system